MKTLSLAVALALGAPAFAQNQAVLAQQGKARCVIVQGASGSSGEAAALLQEYLGKLIGSPVAVVPEAGYKPDGRLPIYVKAAQLAPEEFELQVTPTRITVAGNGKGTYYGALELLEKGCGVRWLMPYEVGEVVPRQPDLKLAAWSQRTAPKLKVRFIRSQYTNGGLWEVSKPFMGDEKRHYELAVKSNLWYDRQRLAYGVRLDGSHSNENWWERFGSKHVDWFAMQPNGQRAVPSSYAGYEKLCVTHPGVLAQIVADARAALKKDPTLQSIPVGPNDGADSGYCMCPVCQGWDDPRGVKLRFLTSSLRPEEAFEYVSLSDRYAHHYARVAERLKTLRPDLLAVGLAYGNYTRAPLQQKMPNNVVIMYVGANDYQYDRDRQQTREDILGWGRAGAQIGWRPNWLRHDGWPITYPHKLGEDLKAYYRAGLRYGDFDTSSNDWGASGITLYVLARLLWDPEQSVDAIIGDYLDKGYGPAAPAMLRYFNRLESASTRMAAQADPRNYWYLEAIKVWTPDFFTNAFQDLAEADRLAGGDARIRKRIDLCRQGMEWTQLHTEMARAIQQGDRARAAALLRKREDWYQKHLYTEAMPVPYIRFQHDRFKAFFEP